MIFYKTLLKIKSEYTQEINDMSIKFWSEAVGIL
mgnify:CR=1 FL=1|jgi:hypothetical protein